MLIRSDVLLVLSRGKLPNRIFTQSVERRKQHSHFKQRGRAQQLEGGSLYSLNGRRGAEQAISRLTDQSRKISAKAKECIRVQDERLEKRRNSRSVKPQELLLVAENTEKDSKIEELVDKYTQLQTETIREIEGKYRNPLDSEPLCEEHEEMIRELDEADMKMNKNRDKNR